MKKDNKTIAITLRFWTSNIAVGFPLNKIADYDKVCWDFGMANLEANKKKGMRAINQPFNCYEDIIPVIKELLRKAGVVVVSDNRRPRILSHRRKSK
ncbi:MAG: hypothetical protein WC208_10465 [Gallionella sp.]